MRGRAKLFSQYISDSLTENKDYAFTNDKVCQVFNSVLPIHQANANDIEYLLNYVKGKQPILERIKEVRSDIDNKIIVNHAYEITRNLVGYTFGKPIKYVPRQASKRGKVKKLNDYIMNEDKFSSDQELATYLSVCGIGFRGIFNNPYDFDKTIPFTITQLDPRRTFVVYSSDSLNIPVMAATYYETEPTSLTNNKTIITIYTHDFIYVYEVNGFVSAISSSNLKSRTINILKRIPIVEYENNIFRMGDWEIALELLDAINTVTSDSVNDLVQFVQSILVAVNAEFNEEDIKNLKKNKIISITSSKELPSDLKYIAQQADANSMENLRTYLLEQLESVVGMPSRNKSSGSSGDTGDAVYLRDGYENLEIVARIKESFFRKGERLSLGLILEWLVKDNAFSGLKVNDVDIKFTRNSTDNLLVKANALATLNGAKILAPTDTISLVGISTEPDELAQRGEDYWKEKDAELLSNQQQNTSQNVNKQTDPSMKQKVER